MEGQWDWTCRVVLLPLACLLCAVPPIVGVWAEDLRSQGGNVKGGGTKGGEAWGLRNQAGLVWILIPVLISMLPSDLRPQALHFPFWEVIVPPLELWEFDKVCTEPSTVPGTRNTLHENDRRQGQEMFTFFSAKGRDLQSRTDWLLHFINYLLEKQWI